jgi:GNAT superfamily N-acetyltransferase
MTGSRTSIEQIEVRVEHAPTLSVADRAAVHRVFEASYAEPNHEYLDRSIDRIGMLAVAVDAAGDAIGYAISRGHWLDLPRFDQPQLVLLHGMRCVAPEYRHRGVSGLVNRAVTEAVLEEIFAVRRPERRLECGRYGHASRAGGRDDLNAVPRVGVSPTAWQREVGLMVADAYGSNLDPETFVCIGSGSPIGYPNAEFPATAAERSAFAPVDRARGDNLLVIHWSPDAPPGWNDSD